MLVHPATIGEIEPVFPAEQERAHLSLCSVRLGPVLETGQVFEFHPDDNEATDFVGLVPSSMAEAQAPSVSRDFAVGGAALVGLATALTVASNLEGPRARVRAAVRAVDDCTRCTASMPSTARDQGSERDVGVNVSDVFVARYVDALEHDPLVARSRETGRAVYSLGLMWEKEWQESLVYRDAYSTHRMLHVVEAPIITGDEVVGALPLRRQRARP